MIKILFTLLFLGIAYNFTASFCNRQTDGFSVARIHSELSFNPEWETAPPSEEMQKELNSALSQKFHYMTCGGQCFAFGSEDGKYVIKFFKHKVRKPYSYFLSIPLPETLDKWRKRRLDKALAIFNRDFTSYKIAYEDLQEETGLIYIHLNKNTSLNRSVSIVDKIGITHQIPLDGIEFVVQKRAQLAYAHIKELAAHGNKAEARQAVRAILDIIVSRCKKGIFDEDSKIHRNFGFLGDKSIFIDVGRFVRDSKRKDPAVYKADLIDITKHFREWLNKTHPELVSILDEEFNEYQTAS